ncbi:VOC family protein [Alsobacter sp. R-9]
MARSADPAPAALPPRLHLVTLAVADVARARLFYEALGWRASADSQPTVAFFDCGGTILSLYGRDALARDTGASVPPTGPAVTLAYNVATQDAVQRAVDVFLAAGATLVKAAATAEWGGTIAFVADPDGHVWEVAHNPFWPFDGEGRLVLPPPAG